MKLKAPDIKKEKDILIHNDKLDRLDNITNLIRILKNTEDPLVISIDGAYGSGKTYFVSLWKAILEDQGFPTIYLSVWESDYYENAMVAILGEINEKIDDILTKSANNSTLEKIKDDFLKLGSKILDTLPTVGRIATTKYFAISKEDIEDLKKAFDGTDPVLGDQINQYKNLKNYIKEFRDKLEELVPHLSTKEENGVLPLVIFIDELDRCKPTYAIEVLEVIKHIFNVPDVMFVLAINKKQLSESLKTVYGADMEIDGYLKRFIDLDYMLPSANLMMFIESLFANFGLNQKFKDRKEFPFNIYDQGTIAEVFYQLFTTMQIPPRIQEKCMAQVSVALLLTEDDDQIFPYLFAPLLCIKAKDSDIYEKFIKNRDPAALIEYLQEYLGTISKRQKDIIEYFIKVSVLYEEDGKKLNEQYRRVVNGDTINTSISNNTANNVIDYISDNNVDENSLYGCLIEVINKIEISSQFSRN